MSKYKYVTVYNHPLFPGKSRQVLKHRLVMAEFLGRSLLRTELIHHKDENKTNNIIRNLKMMNHSGHATHHWNGKHLSKEARNKMSLAHIGKHHSKETRMKMSLGLKDHYLGQKFPGV